MVHYSVTPEAVSAVVTAVEDELSVLPELHGTATAAGEAAASAAGGGAVASAVQAFFADRADSLPSLARHVQACTGAAVTALAAYDAADALMAATADLGVIRASGIGWSVR